MANAIYTTTRDELAGLVSRQVASGLLSRAVASVGSDPSTIDATTMSRLLRGRVRRELERTLPRAGVRRRLADIDARLAREHGQDGSGSDRNRPRRPAASGRPEVLEAPPATTTPAPASASQVAGPSDAVATDGGRATKTEPRRSTLPVRPATVWSLEPADTGTFDDRRRAFPIAGDVVTARPAVGPAVGPAVEPTMPTAMRPPTTPATTRLTLRPTLRPTLPPVAPPPASPSATPSATPSAPARARPDRLIERVTDDDAVRQWIWSPAHGPAEGRGAGPDADRVVAVLGSLTTVLGRHGAVRSLHVRHGRGHVMMGVDRGSTLVIAGDEDLNLGAVYASFRALEEEP